jgi:uncharacterized membrane protein
MKVGKAERDTILKALEDWQQNGNLTPEQATDLKSTVELKTSAAQQIAQYFFIIAISCIVLAFGAIFIDDKLLEKIKTYFSLSNVFISIAFLLMSIAWFWYCKKKIANKTSLAYEVYMVMGALLLLISLVYACKDVGFGAGHSGFLFIVAALFAVLTLLMRSRALWIGFILAIMGWYGSFTEAHSHNNLFLHMNYPVRFALFGIVVLLFSYLQRFIKNLSFTNRTTYLAGLVILFTALWGVSIMGNYSMNEWSLIRQTQVIIYPILFGAICFISFYLGLKRGDDTTRDFGLLFLLINLYTMYFEFFWGGLNKGIFFGVLAISFWLIGRFIERRKRPANNSAAL